jgi:hypothetical protein
MSGDSSVAGKAVYSAIGGHSPTPEQLAVSTRVVSGASPSLESPVRIERCTPGSVRAFGNHEEQYSNGAGCLLYVRPSH